MAGGRPLVMNILYVVGIIFAVIIFFGICAWPVWRFATLIENAVADDATIVNSSSSFGNSSSVLSNKGDEEDVPDHGTLIGLWVGLVWAAICLASVGLPLYVGPKFSFFQWFCRWMSRVGYQFLTTILWLLPLLAIWEIVNAVEPRAHGGSEHGDGAKISAIIIAAIAIFVTVVHLIHALALYTKHITIVSPKVKQPFTIAHISDVHIGSRTKMWLRRVVNKVNSEPTDAVIISGDLFDYPGVQNHEMDPIFDVKSPIYAVSGNHDLATGDESYKRLYSYMAKKITIVDGISLPLPGQSGALVLGVEDCDEKEAYLNVVRQLAKNIDLDPERSGAYRILVNHRPWGFRHMATEQLADLLLSGHTHAGGQLFMFIPLVKYIFPMYHGYYTIGDRHMFCSPGTGTWGPYVREWGFNLVTFITVKPPAEGSTGDPSDTSKAIEEQSLCPETDDNQ